MLRLCSQAPWEVEDKKPPPEWPMEGNVEFRDYSVRYREGLDLVLKKLSLSVKGGEKVGRVRWGHPQVIMNQEGGFTNHSSVCTDWYRWSHRGRQVLHDALPLPIAGSCSRRDHHWWGEDIWDRPARPEVPTHHHTTGTQHIHTQIPHKTRDRKSLWQISNSKAQLLLTWSFW